MNFQPLQVLAPQLPDFCMCNITSHFIERMAKDGKSANDFKSVNKKAFPLFKDGHVQNITASVDDEIKCIYKCSCLPEMKKNITYSITLAVNKMSGDIVTATCGCPAGHGPTGSCKHIAALCYALEEFARVKVSKDYVACTSKLQQWNQPRKRKLEPSSSGDIKFVKLEYGKTKREPSSQLYDPHPPSLQRTSQEEIGQFVSELNGMKKPCAFTHVLTAKVESSTSQQSSSLPPIPRSSREKVLVKMRSSSHPLSLQQISELGNMFLHLLSPSQQLIKMLADATIAQNQSKRWHEERFGRLTSSRFGEIIKCRQPTTTCARLLYPSKSHLSSAELKWGQDNECRARGQYTSQLSLEFRVLECGIHISESGYLGASPDGLVRRADNNEVVGVIEIKCPFSARNCSLDEMCSKPSFFCHKKSRIHLRTNHNYYYQVQGQLAILKVKWCDFIIWTPSEIHIERIEFDSNFWHNHCLPNL